MKCNQNVLGVDLEKSNTLNYVSDVRQGNLMEPCTIIWLVLFEKRTKLPGQVSERKMGHPGGELQIINNSE